MIVNLHIDNNQKHWENIIRCHPRVTQRRSRGEWLEWSNSLPFIRSGPVAGARWLSLRCSVNPLECYKGGADSLGELPRNIPPNP